LILGIETSGGRCAVAVLDDARTFRRIRPMDRGHAEALFPMIDETLAEACARHADLSRVAVCTGPGSFSGIRIGIAAARGLALGLGVPALGISRLEALAAEAATGCPAAVRVPGPGGTVYSQYFDADGKPEAPPQRLGSDAALPAGRMLIGPGGVLPESFPDPAVIARLGTARAASGRPAPLYLRDAGAAPPREAPPPLLDP
jgi:tRNA threonylcarbamoyl adenosine modification protein YeaZ